MFLGYFIRIWSISFVYWPHLVHSTSLQPYRIIFDSALSYIPFNKNNDIDFRNEHRKKSKNVPHLFWCCVFASFLQSLLRSMFIRFSQCKRMFDLWTFNVFISSLQLQCNCIDIVHLRICFGIIQFERAMKEIHLYKESN